MRQRITVVVACAAFLSAVASMDAQEWRGQGRIDGTVKSTSGEPIPGAKVSLRWGKSGHGGPDVTTDSKGHWAFFGLAGGPWDLDFSASGFQPKKISAEFQEGARNPSIPIQLEPVPKEQAQTGGTHEELMVGGKKISKDTAAAVEAGNDALAQKKYAEARESYLKAVQELPDYSPLLMRLSAAYFGEGNNDEALKYARKAADLDPSDLAAWRTIAEIELSKGNLDAGKAALDKVPPDKITDPGPYLNMGIILYNKKQAAAAEEAFNKALTVNADLADAYYYRALARIQLKRVPEAKADLKKYLELSPTGADAADAKELLKSL